MFITSIFPANVAQAIAVNPALFLKFHIMPEKNKLLFIYSNQEWLKTAKRMNLDTKKNLASILAPRSSSIETKFVWPR